MVQNLLSFSTRDRSIKDFTFITSNKELIPSKPDVCALPAKES
jgi:hypothetical protein